MLCYPSLVEYIVVAKIYTIYVRLYARHSKNNDNSCKIAKNRDVILYDHARLSCGFQPYVLFFFVYFCIVDATGQRCHEGSISRLHYAKIGLPSDYGHCMTMTIAMR